MDHFTLDISLELEEDGFVALGSQLSSASSARSCSTAPSCAPITPQSGRSTPQQQHTASTSFTSSVTDYSFTPPGSSMNDYFPPEVKLEHPSCDIYPSTPSRRSTTSSYSMELDHDSLVDSSLQPFDNLMSFTTPGLEHYPFSEHLSSSPFHPPPSPFNGPPPPYSLHNTACDNPALWQYPVDNSMFFLEKSGSSPSMTGSMEGPGFHDSRPPYFIRSAQSQPMSDAQQRSSVLHHVQNGNKLSRRERYTGNLDHNIKTIRSSSHKCTVQGCPNINGYQRMEHLKRHMETKHGVNTCKAQCVFCEHKFNRKDNWISHLKLHCRKERSGSGTARAQYFPEAQAVYDAEMARTKRRITAKKRLAEKM